MQARQSLPEGYQKTSAMDFGRNKRQLYLSYLLRFASLLFFLVVFALVGIGFHASLGSSLLSFVDIAIPGLPGVLSILFIALDVFLVLALHELVHASVFWMFARSQFQIGIRGAVIFAAAPDWYFTKAPMVINALAPFTVISIIGIVLMGILPVTVIAWIFIPVVVNAAAAAGDFMLLIWIAGQKEGTFFKDTGDATVSYAPLSQ